jgi:hypothetical protein
VVLQGKVSKAGVAWDFSPAQNAGSILGTVTEGTDFFGESARESHEEWTTLA